MLTVISIFIRQHLKYLFSELCNLPFIINSQDIRIHRRTRIKHIFIAPPLSLHTPYGKITDLQIE